MVLQLALYAEVIQYLLCFSAADLAREMCFWDVSHFVPVRAWNTLY